MNPAQQSPKKNVFISYRVSDTAGETGRLVDALKNHFEEDQIFMDIDKIEPGVDFTEVISRSLDSCEVMLAIIGPNWQGRDANGQSRIKKDDDWVRLELSTALKRNIRVVPVLVDGAALPDGAELPPDLEGLLRRQSYEISNKRWRYDTEQLIGFLQNNIGVRPKRIAPNPPLPPPGPPRAGMNIWLKVALGIFSVLGLIFFIAVIVEMGKGDQTDQTAAETGTTPRQIVGPVTRPASGAASSENMPADVNGNWIDPEGGVLAVQQSGNKLTIQVYHNNNQTGSGTGYIEGSHVEMSVNMLNVAMVTMDLELTKDGSRMNGNLTATAEGKTNTLMTILTRAAD